MDQEVLHDSVLIKQLKLIFRSGVKDTVFTKLYG